MDTLGCWISFARTFSPSCNPRARGFRRTDYTPAGSRWAAWELWAGLAVMLGLALVALVVVVGIFR